MPSFWVRREVATPGEKLRSPWPPPPPPPPPLSGPAPPSPPGPKVKQLARAQVVVEAPAPDREQPRAPAAGENAGAAAGVAAGAAAGDAAGAGRHEARAVVAPVFSHRRAPGEASARGGAGGGGD